MLPKPRGEPCFLRFLPKASQLSQDKTRSEARAREGGGKRVSGRASVAIARRRGPLPAAPLPPKQPRLLQPPPSRAALTRPSATAWNPSPPRPGIAKWGGVEAQDASLPGPSCHKRLEARKRRPRYCGNPSAAVRTHHAGPRRRVYNLKGLRLRSRPPRRQGRGLVRPPHSRAGSRPRFWRSSIGSGAWTGRGRLSSRLRSLSLQSATGQANLRIIATGSLLRPECPGVRGSGLPRVGDLGPTCC